jgi:hypothetical protein
MKWLVFSCALLILEIGIDAAKENAFWQFKFDFCNH